MKISNIFLIAIAASSQILQGDGHTDKNTASCNGAFDIYFILDLSSSLLKDGTNHFEKETVSFVKLLVDRFTSPLMRFSFITFNDEAKLVMPITFDRHVIEKKLIELRKAVPHGSTNLNLGLGNATYQIRLRGGRRASVIIVLTDGILESKVIKLAAEKSSTARRLGATVISVGVGRYKRKQLLLIAGGLEQLLFEAASFDGLNGIVKEIVDRSCVEITSAYPQTVVCSNTTFELRIDGRGFDKTGNYEHVKCNYWFNNEKSFLVDPTSYSPTRLTCPLPNRTSFMPGDVVTIQLSLNGGVTFISSNVTLRTVSCIKDSTFTLAMVFIFLFLLLLAAWWFAKALCCCCFKREEPKKPPRPMAPPPPLPVTQKTIEMQQWPVVDTSYYGGRGAGGINPMKVNWGDKGCTDAGLHLERAKDAKEVGHVSREVAVASRPTRPSLPASPKSSCCGSLVRGVCRPFITFYSNLANKRPSCTDLKNFTFVKSARISKSHPSDASLTGGYLDTRN